MDVRVDSLLLRSNRGCHLSALSPKTEKELSAGQGHGMVVEQSQAWKVKSRLTLKECPDTEQSYVRVQMSGGHLWELEKKCSHFGAPGKSRKGGCEWPDTRHIDL